MTHPPPSSITKEVNFHDMSARFLEGFYCILMRNIIAETLRGFRKRNARKTAIRDQPIAASPGHHWTEEGGDAETFSKCVAPSEAMLLSPDSSTGYL
jgi:hypothetical protein